MISTDWSYNQVSQDFDIELARVLKAQAPHDESLHSTLFRELLAYDPNAKPIGIIDDNGWWAQDPFIQHNYQHIFHRYPDHLLLEKIDLNISISGEGNNVFNSPTEYADRISEIFFSKRKSRSRSKSRNEIKYCLCCIEESIKEYGYGYFRYFWQFSNFCLIHNTILKALPQQNFNKSVSAIKTLLSGVDVKNSYPAKNESGEISIKRDFSYHERYFYPVKIASCARPLFAKWVHINQNRLSPPSITDYCIKVNSLYRNVHSIDEKNYIERYAPIFMLASSFSPELLKFFFELYVDLVKVNFGPRNQGILSEVFAKKPNENCESCKEKSCFMKKGYSSSIVKFEDFNYDNLFQNSYSFKRLLMQNSTISHVGMDIWSPIDVYNNQEKTIHHITLP